MMTPEPLTDAEREELAALDARIKTLAKKRTAPDAAYVEWLRKNESIVRIRETLAAMELAGRKKNQK